MKADIAIREDVVWIENSNPCGAMTTLGVCVRVGGEGGGGRWMLLPSSVSRLWRAGLAEWIQSRQAFDRFGSFFRDQQGYIYALFQTRNAWNLDPFGRHILLEYIQPRWWQSGFSEPLPKTTILNLNFGPSSDHIFGQKSIIAVKASLHWCMVQSLRLDRHVSTPKAHADFVFPKLN